jgi:hypothetical protein
VARRTARVIGMGEEESGGRKTRSNRGTHGTYDSTRTTLTLILLSSDYLVRWPLELSTVHYLPHFSENELVDGVTGARR